MGAWGSPPEGVLKGWVRRRLRGEGGVQLAQSHDLVSVLTQNRAYLIGTGHQKERPILFDIAVNSQPPTTILHSGDWVRSHLHG